MSVQGKIGVKPETLNIITTHRLGKIESAVLLTLAENTLDNELMYTMKPLSEYYHSHDDDRMKRSELYYACGGALSHLSTRSASSAYGRAVHSLFDKGLVCVFALAWCMVEKDSTGKFVEDGWVDWAGPGRPALKEMISLRGGGTYASKQKSPVLSVILLTTAGWAIARQDHPGIGLCPLCKEYLEKSALQLSD